MKLIIAGGRDYRLTPEDLKALSIIHELEPVSEVVSGGATGADECGEEWAAKHGIPVKKFHPDWKRFGKFAGPERNGRMARYADAVALFPGGRGTESMANQAEFNRLRVFDLRSGKMIITKH